MIYLFNESFILLFLAGAVGALIADILKDNCLIMPKKIDGKLLLGCIGGIFIGGIAGLIVDGQLLTAFMGGFMGKEIITRLVIQQLENKNKNNTDTK